MSRRIKSGELLAVEQSAISRDADGFFLLMGNPPPANRRVGSVAIVSIRDALEHHMCPYSDSYEAILQRVRCAMLGQKEPEGQSEGTSHPEPDGDETQGEKPSAVILDIDSPGGVVAGLNETVLALRKMSKKYGVKLVAYVNELAASAAFAITCSCEWVAGPESCIVGSVGVVSTMVSQVEADKRAGYHVVLLTSGKRKADGHVHAPITSDALKAEKHRLDQSAASFFAMVSKARGIPVKKIRALEAGIYQGPEAVDIGLADEVVGLQEAIFALSDDSTPALGEKADGNETDRRALDVSRETGSQSTQGKLAPVKGNPAMLKLVALIKRTEAAIAAEKDPEKLADLYMSLSAYKKTEKHIEHTKSEEDDDDDDDDSDKKDDEDDEDEKKSAKKSEEDEEASSAKKSAKKMDDEEDEEESAKKSEEEEASATAASIVALAQQRTGKSGKALVGAVAAMFELSAQVPDLKARVARIEGTGRKTQRETLIANAVATRRITKPMAAKLGRMKLEAVQSALELFSGPIVTTDEDGLRVPDETKAATRSAAGLSAEDMAGIDLAVKGTGMTGDKAAALRQQMIADAKKTVAELNGAGGRF